MLESMKILIEVFFLIQAEGYYDPSVPDPSIRTISKNGN